MPGKGAVKKIGTAARRTDYENGTYDLFRHRDPPRLSAPAPAPCRQRGLFVNGPKKKAHIVFWSLMTFLSNICKGGVRDPGFLNSTGK